VVVLFLTKFSTPEILGMYSFNLAVITPINMFFSFQLKAQYASDARNQFSGSEYFSQRFSLGVLASIISLVVLAARGDYLLFVMGFFLVFQQLFDSFSDLIYGYYIKNNYVDILGRSLIFKSLLITIGSFVAIKMFSLGVYFPIALFSASLVVLVFYDRRMSSGIINVDFNKLYNRDLIKKVFPLGVVMGLISLKSNFQKYLIESFLGYEQLAVFAVLTYFLVLGSLLYKAVVDGFFPYFVKYYNDGNIKKFWMLCYRFSIVVIFVSVIFMALSTFAGKDVLSFFYSKDYAMYQDVLISISYASLPIYLNAVLGSCLTSMQKYRIQTYGVAVDLIFGIIFGFYFVPLYGIIGAVYAMLVGAIFRFFLLFYFLKKYLDEKAKGSSYS